MLCMCLIVNVVTLGGNFGRCTVKQRVSGARMGWALEKDYICVDRELFRLFVYIYIYIYIYRPIYVYI